MTLAGRPGLFAVALAVAVLALPALSAADQKDPALDGLFQRLKLTADPGVAQVIEEAIWRIWTRNGAHGVDVVMASGIEAMNAGALEDALARFDDVVRRAPDFAEGWNKRATVHYLMGNFTASVADIRRTLALEPRHFGALSGMGLIFDAIGNHPAALKVWEKALQINPHMPSIVERVRQLRTQSERERT
ncbi:MAG: tetratricopeptide repeat protein [Rhodospirillales bacterium]